MSNITDLQIRGAISRLQAGQGGQETLREGSERGAGRLCIVLRKGANHVIAEWYVQWHRRSERKSTKLGRYPDLTLAAARKLYREDYVPAILEGKNPEGPRVWTKRKNPTLQDLGEAYLTNMRERGCAEESIRTAKYCLLGPSGILVKLGLDRPVSAITADDVMPFLTAKKREGRAHQANNWLAFTRAAFEFAIKSRYSYHLAGSGIEWGITLNPIACIPPDPAAFRPRDRHLSPGEFKAFWNWLTVKGRSVRYRFAPAIQIMMATGQRVNEILSLGPAGFDECKGLISWPTTKNGRPHCIPLPRQALAILKAATANEHGYFFAGQRVTDKPAAPTVNEWVLARYFEETGAEAFTARDLRRTWKTLTGAAGISKEIRDRIQNHALNDVSTKHYDRHDYMAEKRGAMERWEAYLAELLTGDPEGEVDFARPVRVTKVGRKKVKAG